MKSTTIICAIAAASLGFSALALAQGDDRHGAREGHRVEHQDRRDERRDERRDHRRDDRRFDEREARQNDRNQHYNARSPEFRRGGHIPREFHNRQYVVTDYRTHRLNPPPRGHQWVQVGADYVLIAIATGLIAQIILSH